MDTFLRLTGTATLLIGLQLFSLGIASATNTSGVPTNIPSGRFFVALVADASGTSNLEHLNKDYNPPDNNGPVTSQGSGTR